MTAEYCFGSCLVKDRDICHDTCHPLPPTASVDQAMFAAVGIILAELYTGKVGLVGPSSPDTLSPHLKLSCHVLPPIPLLFISLYISLHLFTPCSPCSPCDSRMVLTRLASTLQRFEQLENLMCGAVGQCSLCRGVSEWKQHGEGHWPPFPCMR